MRWIGYPLALLAVFVLVGGHWAVLQTVAWAGMLRTYTQAYGLAGGVEKTFSGQHPCKMCLKVQDGQKQEEQKPPLLKTEKKAEALLDNRSFQMVHFFVPGENWPLTPPDFSPARRDPPLSPPPQTFS